MKNLQTALSQNKLTRISTAARVLVNDARRALGLRPLTEWFKGYRHMADCCPISFALAVDENHVRYSFRIDPEASRAAGTPGTPLIDGITALFPTVETAALVAAAWGRAAEGDDGRQVVLPFAVAHFARLFDEGHYPALAKSVIPNQPIAA